MLMWAQLASKLGLMFAALAFVASAPLALAQSGVCTEEGSISACVRNITLTVDFKQPGRYSVLTSLQIEVKNNSTFPIGVAFVSKDQVSVTPEGAGPLQDDANSFSVAGLSSCHNRSSCVSALQETYTQIPAGKSIRVPISYKDFMDIGMVPFGQAAKTATFAATLSIVEGGKQRFAALTLSDVPLNNGLGN